MTCGLYSCVTMQESLKRWWLWWWWWWACLAAAVAAVATGQGQCEVLDLTLKPSAYPLPTNLTVRPLATGWHLNFTLQERESPPAACVRLKETESRVQVMLFKGDCVTGKMKKYNYLPRASVPPHAWTTLAVDVKNNIVLVTAPNHDPVPLKADRWSLSSDTLQMTTAQDVEATVGCHVNCPLYRHASEGPHVKKKVRESSHEKLHFYFRPGQVFNKVHYEVVCKTRQGSEFRREVDLQPGKDDAATAWNVVELEQRESKAKVYLNSKLLEEIQLPESCITSMHVIWTVGEAFFGFDCKPKHVVKEEKEDPVIVEQPGQHMHPAVSAVIAVAVFLPIVIALTVYICYYRKKTSKTSQGNEATSALKQYPATNASEAPPTQWDETRETLLGSDHRETQGPSPQWNGAAQPYEQSAATNHPQDPSPQRQETTQTNEKFAATNDPQDPSPQRQEASQTNEQSPATNDPQDPAPQKHETETNEESIATNDPQDPSPQRETPQTNDQFTATNDSQGPPPQRKVATQTNEQSAATNNPQDPPPQRQVATQTNEQFTATNNPEDPPPQRQEAPQTNEESIATNDPQDPPPQRETPQTNDQSPATDDPQDPAPQKEAPQTNEPFIVTNDLQDPPPQKEKTLTNEQFTAINDPQDPPPQRETPQTNEQSPATNDPQDPPPQKETPQTHEDSTTTNDPQDPPPQRETPQTNEDSIATNDPQGPPPQEKNVQVTQTFPRITRRKSQKRHKTWAAGTQGTRNTLPSVYEVFRVRRPSLRLSHLLMEESTIAEEERHSLVTCDSLLQAD